MRSSFLPLFVLGLVCYSQAHTQSLWTQRSDRASIRLEYLSPQFKSFFPGTTYSFNVLTVGGRVPLASAVAVIAEVPVAWESVHGSGVSDTKSGIGNMYVGIEIGSPESVIFGEVGARPILRQDLKFAGFGGIFGDFDRYEAYVKEMVSYMAAVNVASTERHGFAYRVRIGPTFWAPENGDGTTFIDYGVKAGYDDGAVSVYEVFTGRASTEKGPGKKAWHHIGFDLGYRWNGIRPALFFRIPLDKEISDSVPRTIGASILIEL